MLARLAALVGRRPRTILAVTAVLAALGAAFGASVAGTLAPYDAEDPTSDSARAAARVEAATGVDAEMGLAAVVRLPAGPRAPASRRRTAEVERILARDPIVRDVQTPYSARREDLLSRDGRSALVLAGVRAVSEDRQQEAALALERRLDEVPGVALGGRLLSDAEISETVDADLLRAELIAFPVLFLLSLLVFRGVVAALLPPLIGGLTIVGTLVALRLVNEALPLSVYALNLATGLGLGLAIDYTLFVVSRFREELPRHDTTLAALAATLQTAGRTVLFSALTVSGALACLLVFPQQFLYSMGVAGIVVPLLSAIATLVVLSAVLVLLGPRVDALAPRWLRRRATSETSSDGRWYRLSHAVTRRPARVGLAATVALLLLGLPFLDVAFTSIDARVLPDSTSARQVTDMLDREFRPGRTAPVLLVTRDATPSALRSVAARVRAFDGVDAVSPPRRLDRRTAVIEAYPRADDFAASTRRIVRDARALRGVDVAVGGTTASLLVDLQSSLVDHLPEAIVVLAAVTLLVLFLLTGSVVLPIKALLMNALTMGAALGALVLAFQYGGMDWLFGEPARSALESTQPVLLAALAFGLSTDYGVFLLARIKEARDGGAGEREAIAIGLERTGRIVTAAALLFCVAFLLFTTSRIEFIRQLGFGTAVAVIVDATLVRALLVPSLMALLGKANWWAPRPLRALHARLGLREEAPIAATAEPAGR